LPPGCRLDASSDQGERRVMSNAEELAKLDALRKSGVLTQEEFDAETAKVSLDKSEGSPAESQLVSAGNGAVEPASLPMPPVQMPPASTPTSGSLFPNQPVLEKKTYASAMSYVGSTRRTVAWIKHCKSPVTKGLAVTAGVFFLLFMYLFLVVWYFVVFVLFGIFTFPFRLHRRSQRKSSLSFRPLIASRPVG
jgi:hypothetical protein